MHIVEAELMYIKQAHFCESAKDAARTAERLRKMGAKEITIDGVEYGQKAKED